jgi:SAM-dependent methyltransferase
MDYGYPWWLSYGHAPLLAAAAAVAAFAYRRSWSRWAVGAAAALALWSGAALAVTRFVIDVNGRTELPTEAGTGRSTIMVLQARPQATVVASDLFGASFDQHFGKGATPQDRLIANLRAAGVADRATISTADMRKLPFEAESFDGVVSAYAMDHLNRQGSDEALAEAARVLKPGGDFLLMIVANEKWAKFAFGPLLSHGSRGTAWWVDHVGKAGFTVVESGTRPMTFYVLGRKG